MTVPCLHRVYHHSYNLFSQAENMETPTPGLIHPQEDFLRRCPVRRYSLCSLALNFRMELDHRCSTSSMSTRKPRSCWVGGWDDMPCRTNKCNILPPVTVSPTRVSLPSLSNRILQNSIMHLIRHARHPPPPLRSPRLQTWIPRTPPP